MRDDSVLYHQWLHTSKSDTSQLPEKQLLEAVLVQAFFDLQRTRLRHIKGWKKSLLELQEWFESDDVSYPFSFLAICHALEFDPSTWRKRARYYWTPRPKSVKRVTESEWLEQLAACVPEGDPWTNQNDE